MEGWEEVDAIIIDEQGLARPCKVFRKEDRIYTPGGHKLAFAGKTKLGGWLGHDGLVDAKVFKTKGCRWEIIIPEGR